MSLTAAAISGVVAATVKYLLASEGMQKAAEKAMEKVGELGGEALVNAGKNALAKLRTVLTSKGNTAKKATTALTNLEDDPTDEDYQRKLVSELEKLSATDPQLRTLLEHLSVEVQQAGGQPGTVQGTATVSGEARVFGPVTGASTGTITSSYTIQPDDEAKL